jgi:hypothetical protein
MNFEVLTFEILVQVFLEAEDLKKRKRRNVNIHFVFVKKIKTKQKKKIRSFTFEMESSGAAMDLKNRKSNVSNVR